MLTLLMCGGRFGIVVILAGGDGFSFTTAAFGFRNLFIIFFGDINCTDVQIMVWIYYLHCTGQLTRFGQGGVPAHRASASARHCADWMAASVWPYPLKILCPRQNFMEKRFWTKARTMTPAWGFLSKLRKWVLLCHVLFRIRLVCDRFSEKCCNFPGKCCNYQK